MRACLNQVSLFNIIKIDQQTLVGLRDLSQETGIKMFPMMLQFIKLGYGSLQHHEPVLSVFKVSGAHPHFSIV